MGAAEFGLLQQDLGFQQAKRPIPLGVGVSAPEGAGAPHLGEAFVERSLTELGKRALVALLGRRTVGLARTGYNQDASLPGQYQVRTNATSGNPTAVGIAFDERNVCLDGGTHGEANQCEAAGILVHQDFAEIDRAESGELKGVARGGLTAPRYRVHK